MAHERLICSASTIVTNNKATDSTAENLDSEIHEPVAGSESKSQMGIPSASTYTL